MSFASWVRGGNKFMVSWDRGEYKVYDFMDR